MDLLYVMRYRHKFGWSDYFGERVERERKLGERFFGEEFV